MNTTEDKLTESAWIEESPTHDLQNGNIWFQHSSTDKDHFVRKVYADGTPASEWESCTECSTTPDASTQIEMLNNAAWSLCEYTNVEPPSGFAWEQHREEFALDIVEFSDGTDNARSQALAALRSFDEKYSSLK